VSNIDAGRVQKPPYFRIAPLLRGRGHRKVCVIGFDSEAERGRPFLFQFSSEGDESDVLLVTVPDEPNGGLKAFISYIDAVCTRKDTEYVVFGWNLSYEFTQLFPDLPETDEGIPLSQLPEFTFDTNRRDDPNSRWRVRALNDKRFIATFEHRTTKRRVKLIDGMAYYVTGLDKAGAMLGLGRKLDLDDTYKKNLTRAALHDPVFLAYARQDAYLTRRIGEQILGLHYQYDVPTTTSAPHFAARVFRHHYLTGEIPLPSPDLEQAGLSSYHGGKNGYYLPGPKHLSRIWSYDITSAYPEAMRALPNPVTAEWNRITDYQPGRHALYLVTMRQKVCRYRGAQRHDGTKNTDAYIDGLWITSYELDAMVERGEVTLITCTGWEMSGEPGGPLVEYVDRFFAEKRASTGAAREAAKLFLNSLYGKFFQKQPLGAVGVWDISDTEPVRIEHDPNEPYDWCAGGLYHPPIASLITGYVRAKIHRLEHKYNAVMTSTDGFFARTKPDPADIGSDLGALTVTRGDVSIWRERLYIFDPGQPDQKRKVALHGFRGKADDLARIPLAFGTTTYTATQLVTLRLARRTFTGADGLPVTPGVGTIADLRYFLALAPRAGP